MKTLYAIQDIFKLETRNTIFILLDFRPIGVIHVYLIIISNNRNNIFEWYLLLHFWIATT